jgi:hypothetical protein
LCRFEAISSTQSLLNPLHDLVYSELLKVAFPNPEDLPSCPSQGLVHHNAVVEKSSEAGLMDTVSRRKLRSWFRRRVRVCQDLRPGLAGGIESLSVSRGKKKSGP